MSRNIWLTSDPHYGHENIIKLTGRPFENVSVMNAAMMSRWNEVVGDNDLVYVLGDFYFRAWPTDVHKLKGTKRLICGNHDNCKDELLIAFFQRINSWKMFSDIGLLLTHVPVHPDTFDAYGGTILANVHGHIHERNLDDPRYINVSVEQTDYTPVHIDAIASLAKGGG